MRKLLTLCMSLVLLVCLTVPVSAYGETSTPYVIDDALLLTPEQRETLNDYAREITQTYGVGIYIMTVEDYRFYGESYQIFDVLWNFYHDNGLGYGEDREGMILMLSMARRDYATFFYGEKTEYAFNSFAQEELEDRFLDDFGNDDWYGGFCDYLEASEDFLADAAAGDPVRESPWKLAMLFIGIACLISFVATMLEWIKMKNIAFKKDAYQYRTSEGLVLSQKQDQFLYQNVTRRRIQKASSSGSLSHSGGGGSGRSGKF